MPLPPIPPWKPTTFNDNEDERRSALHSSWIRRLRSDHLPTPHPHSSMPNPFHIKPHQESFVPVDSNRDDGGFGPFRVRPRNVSCPGGESEEGPFSEYRRRFGNVLRPAQELIEQHGSHVDRRGASSSSVQYGTRRGGSDPRDDADDEAARRNFWNPHAFSVYTAHQSHQRQSHSFSSDPEETFSYWNMGRSRGTNFVSAVCPVSLSTADHGRKRTTSMLSTVEHRRKRTASTYGFNISKFRRNRNED